MRESLKYLVVGDTIIDEDVYCKAAGLSLESPTLKTTYNMRKVNYGGAANVARHLHNFNRDVTFLTSIGSHNVVILEDKYGIKVRNYYQGKPNTKTRYWVTHGDATYKYLQINRVNDEESLAPVIDIDLSAYDIIAIADYRCGFVIDSFVKQCLDAGKITYASSQVSSHPSNYYRYEDFDYIVCNERESKTISKKDNVCITKGSDGCSMNGVDYASYKVDNPVNIIGAGDCFYAALLATGDPDFANMKAAEYVESEVYE